MYDTTKKYLTKNIQYILSNSVLLRYLNVNRKELPKTGM